MSENKKCCPCEQILKIVLLVAILISSTVSAVCSYKTNKLLSSGSANAVANVSITKTYAKNQTIEKAKATGKPTVVLFYADWCGFCKKFAPTFNEIVKTRKFKSNLAVAFVDGTNPVNAQYMTEYDVKGFPSVFMVNFKTGEKIKIDNGQLFTVNAKKELLNKFLEFARKK